MPMISRQIQNHDISIQTLYLDQKLLRMVPGAVIHEDHFIGRAHLFKSTPHSAVKLMDALLLIVTRHNDAHSDGVAPLRHPMLPPVEEFTTSHLLVSSPPKPRCSGLMRPFIHKCCDLPTSSSMRSTQSGLYYAFRFRARKQAPRILLDISAPFRRINLSNVLLSIFLTSNW